MCGGKIIFLFNDTGKDIYVILKGGKMAVDVIFWVLGFLSQNMEAVFHRVSSEKRSYNKKTNGQKKNKA